MFACKSVNAPCACLVSLEAKRGIQKLLELELQAMVTRYVGAMKEPRSFAEQCWAISAVPWSNCRSPGYISNGPEISMQGHMRSWVFTVALFRSGSPSWLIITNSRLVASRAGHEGTFQETRRWRSQEYIDTLSLPLSLCLLSLSHNCHGLILCLRWHVCLLFLG